MSGFVDSFNAAKRNFEKLKNKGLHYDAQFIINEQLVRAGKFHDLSKKAETVERKRSLYGKAINELCFAENIIRSAEKVRK